MPQVRPLAFLALRGLLRLGYIGKSAVEDRFLDGIELPGVMLRFYVDPHPIAVVVLLAPDECFGGSVGEVGVDVFPAIGPAGDGVLRQLAKHVPLIRLVGLHELALRPSLHLFVELAFLIAGLAIPVHFDRVGYRLAAVPIHQALVGLVHVQPGDDAVGLNNEDGIGSAMIVYPLPLTVMAQALNEVGPSRSVEVVAGRQARCRLSRFVFCVYGASYAGSCPGGGRLGGVS